MEKLKPCPFCGRAGVLRISPVLWWKGKSKYKVVCIHCGAFTPEGEFNDFSSDPEASFNAQQKAIEVWNRRVNDADN